MGWETEQLSLDGRPRPVGLRPFFSYFGSKHRLARFYDDPHHRTIIEPFAGSAGYSLRWHRSHEVWLYDAYEPVVAVWDYLIHAREEEILGLPLGPFSKTDPVDACTIPEAAKFLLGFWLTTSQTYASRYPQSKVHDGGGGGWNVRKRCLVAKQLSAIRTWKVEQLSYATIPIDREDATWFIDPPYETAGERYRCKDITYKELGSWCQRLPGQVIACESGEASWLPFEELRSSRNASNQPYQELVWNR